MAKKKFDEIGINECVCPVCGKIFFPTPLHVYKRRDKRGRNKDICSYSCVLKYDKEHPRKRQVIRGEMK